MHAHAPFWQIIPDPHAFEQLPHVPGAFNETSQPSKLVPLQFEYPPSQPVIAQLPLLHSLDACASAQGVLQPPQSVIVLVGRSQPF